MQVVQPVLQRVEEPVEGTWPFSLPVSQAQELSRVEGLAPTTQG
jgi:hypothetical protein